MSGEKDKSGSWVSGGKCGCYSYINSMSFACMHMYKTLPGEDQKMAWQT